MDHAIGIQILNMRNFIVITVIHILRPNTFRPHTLRHHSLRPTLYALTLCAPQFATLYRKLSYINTALTLHGDGT